MEDVEENKNGFDFNTDQPSLINPGNMGEYVKELYEETKLFTELHRKYKDVFFSQLDRDVTNSD